MEEIDKKFKSRKSGDISGEGRLRLAKTILLFSILTYLLIAVLYIFSDLLFLSGPIKQVWSFSSQAIFGIVNVLIGFYFGDKTPKE